MFQIKYFINGVTLYLTEYYPRSEATKGIIYLEIQSITLNFNNFRRGITALRHTFAFSI